MSKTTRGFIRLVLSAALILSSFPSLNAAVVITGPTPIAAIPGAAAAAALGIHSLNSPLSPLSQLSPSLLTTSLAPALSASALQSTVISPLQAADALKAPQLAPLPQLAIPQQAAADAEVPATPGEKDAAPSASQDLQNLSKAVADDKDQQGGLERYYDSAGKDAHAAVAADEKGISLDIYEGLNPGWIKRQIKQSKQADPATKALQAQAHKKGFRKTAINDEIVAQHNNRYTNELSMGKIADQKMSGRCWIFAGMNMIRDMLVAKGKVSKDFEFSRNYLYFFAQLERANSHIEKVIRAVYAGGEAGASLKEFGEASPQLSDGGSFQELQFLINKYGLVPNTAMPETRSSRNTDLMDDELAYSVGKTMQALQADARDLVTGRGGGRVMEIKQRGIEEVWKILSAHLGVPPSDFSFGTKTGRKAFTPKSFASRFVRFDPHDYVTVAAMPHHHRGAAYEEPDSQIGVAPEDKDSFPIRYLNVDMDRLEALAAKAIEAGYPVPFGASMNRDADPKTGIMHPRIYDRSKIYDSEDAQRHMTRTREIDLGLQRGGHEMVITGFDRPEAGQPVVKYKVENSWGKKAGDNGVFHMYREWFREYILDVTIPRSLLSAAERKAWDGKARPERD